MDYLFIAAYALWLISEIAINRLLRSRGTDLQGADKGSLGLIWMGVIIAVIIAVFISFTFNFAIANTIWLQYSGMMLMIVGIILRIIAVRMLGKYFTADVTIRADHQLFKKGFYKYFRHPSYTASLLTFVGFGISLNNWVSLAVIVVAVALVFKVRIKVEENALTTKFGPEYLQYKKEAWGLIPFIY